MGVCGTCSDSTQCVSLFWVFDCASTPAVSTPMRAVHSALSTVFTKWLPRLPSVPTVGGIARVGSPPPSTWLSLRCMCGGVKFPFTVREAIRGMGGGGAGVGASLGAGRPSQAKTRRRIRGRRGMHPPSVATSPLIRPAPPGPSSCTQSSAGARPRGSPGDGGLSGSFGRAVD